VITLAVSGLAIGSCFGGNVEPRGAIDRDQNEVPRKHNEHVQELEQFRYCTEQNLAEITEKLNSLIGYVGGWKPPQALG